MNYISPLKNFVTLLLVGSAISLSPPTNASILKQGFNLLRGLDTSEPDRRARNFCEDGRSEFGKPSNAKTDSEYQYILRRCMDKYQPEFRAGYRKTLDSSIMRKFEFENKKCEKINEEMMLRKPENKNQKYWQERGYPHHGLEGTPIYNRWEKCHSYMNKKYPLLRFYFRNADLD